MYDLLQVSVKNMGGASEIWMTMCGLRTVCLQRKLVKAFEDLSDWPKDAMEVGKADMDHAL